MGPNGRKPDAALREAETKLAADEGNSDESDAGGAVRVDPL